MEIVSPPSPPPPVSVSLRGTLVAFDEAATTQSRRQRQASLWAARPPRVWGSAQWGIDHIMTRSPFL